MTILTTPSVEVVRCYTNGKTYSDMQPYDGCAQITYMPPRAAIVTGMHGQWCRSDLHTLLRRVHSQGIPWLLADRGPGHSLPWGELVNNPGTPGDGMWRIDLVEMFGALPVADSASLAEAVSEGAGND